MIACLQGEVYSMFVNVLSYVGIKLVGCARGFIALCTMLHDVPKNSSMGNHVQI